MRPESPVMLARGASARYPLTLSDPMPLVVSAEEAGSEMTRPALLTTLRCLAHEHNSMSPIR
jgi:hypothetical protein